ncbi:MAG TPA: peptidase T [Virgibacillus sp.]|nr:peptidase T [Virgibacillus sp.]
MKKILIERLTTYAKIDTQSNDQNDHTPSTPGQMELANLLVEELKKIGMCDVTIDNHGYVMATLSANTDKQVPTIGFLAHVDTATDFTGKNVKPQIVNNYDGNDLILNKELDIVLSSTDFPELSSYQGHTLMTTDGTTLLGADNKAGIAEIMTAMEYLLTHPEIKHGKIRIAFTPDEEIGRGPHKFDVEQFNATYAYTVDGGPLGELQYESFNAAVANITFKGSNVHPGTAKDKMVHAGKIAAEFIEKFPEQEAPEYTEKYQGFYHLLSMSGDVEKAELTYIIRDFDQLNFEARKKEVDEFITEIKERHPRVQVERTISDQYYNMREKIEPVIEVVDLAHQAMVNLDITPIVEPIRGGTDGSQLSYKGLPTPNIFTGGENFHGKFEYVSVDHMEKATEVIVEICRLFEAK